MKPLTGDFHPENFKEEYENRVEQLIESKQGQAEAPAAQPKRKLAPVIDLMEALRRSMGQAAPGSVTASAPPPNPDDDEKKPPQRSTKAPARRKKAAAG
jgi:DNA end-binding protein Ku